MIVVSRVYVVTYLWAGNRNTVKFSVVLQQQ